MLWLPWLRHGPHLGSLQRLLDPPTRISNILFEIITELLREAGAAPAQNEWVGDIMKKIETYGRSLWHTKCSIIFLRRKPGALPLYLQENKVFWLIPKESVLCGQMQRKQFTICRMTDVRVRGRSPQPPEAREIGDKAPSVWRFLQFFKENNTFLGIIGLNFCLKIYFPIFFNHTKGLTI